MACELSTLPNVPVNCSGLPDIYDAFDVERKDCRLRMTQMNSASPSREYCLYVCKLPRYRGCFNDSHSSRSISASPE